MVKEQTDVAAFNVFDPYEWQALEFLWTVHFNSVFLVFSWEKLSCGARNDDVKKQPPQNNNPKTITVMLADAEVMYTTCGT